MSWWSSLIPSKVQCTTSEQSVIQGILDALVQDEPEEGDDRRLDFQHNNNNNNDFNDAVVVPDDRELKQYCNVCGRNLPVSCCNNCAGFPCGQCYIGACNRRRLDEEVEDVVDWNEAEMSMLEDAGMDRNLLVEDAFDCLAKWTKVKTDLILQLASLGTLLSPQCIWYSTMNLKVDYTYTAE